MRRHLLRAVLLVAMSAGPAWSQAIDAPEVESPSDNSSFFVRGAYGHRFETDLDDSNGEFDTNDARGEIGGTAAFDGGVRWLNLLGYGFNNYGSDVADSNIHNLNFASIVSFEVGESWRMMVGPLVSVYAEEGADWGDAVSYGGLLGAVYRNSPTFSIGLAVAVMRRIEEGIGIAPIPLIDWRFARNWRLHTGVTEVAARRGIGGFVGWTFANHWEVAAGAQFERRRFRLEDKGITSDFIVQDKSAPVYARLSWGMADGLALDLYGGVAVAGKIRVSDDDDHFVADDKYDPAPLVGVRLRYETDL